MGAGKTGGSSNAGRSSRMVNGGGVVYLQRFEGEDWTGEVSGDMYSDFRLRELIWGVLTVFSGMSPAKSTVLRGVDFCTALLLRLMAARVMSCSCRPELESVLDPCVEGRGVKNRVNRLGVMGGGFLMRLLVVDAEGIGGDELRQSGRGSMSALRAANGEDMFIADTCTVHR
jgi:hypothetical protein